jgi:hypothetical protein
VIKYDYNWNGCNWVVFVEEPTTVAGGENNVRELEGEISQRAPSKRRSLRGRSNSLGLCFSSPTCSQHV